MNEKDAALIQELTQAFAVALAESVRAIAKRSKQVQGFEARAIGGDLIEVAKKMPDELEIAKSIVNQIGMELTKATSSSGA